MNILLLKINFYQCFSLKRCVNTLLQNLKTTKIQTDPKLIEQYLKDEDEKKEELDSEQIFEREGQYTMKPIGKKSTVLLFLLKH